MLKLRFIKLVIALAFVPPAMALLHADVSILAIAGAIWFVIATLYCLRVREKSALWVFLLLPVAFFPFVALILWGFFGNGEF